MCHRPKIIFLFATFIYWQNFWLNGTSTNTLVYGDRSVLDEAGHSEWTCIQMTCSGLRMLPEAVRLLKILHKRRSRTDRGRFFFADYFSWLVTMQPTSLCNIVFLGFYSEFHMRRNRGLTRSTSASWLDRDSVFRCHGEYFCSESQLAWAITHSGH